MAIGKKKEPMSWVLTYQGSDEASEKLAIDFFSQDTTHVLHYLTRNLRPLSSYSISWLCIDCFTQVTVSHLVDNVTPYPLTPVGKNGQDHVPYYIFTFGFDTNDRAHKKPLKLVYDIVAAHELNDSQHAIIFLLLNLIAPLNYKMISGHVWWVSLLGSFILWWGLWICSEPPVITWWMCDCRSNCVPGTDNSLTPSWELRRASSFILVTPIVLLFSDAFSKEALIPACSLHSEFADTLVTSRPEDAFNDLIAYSIFAATMLSMAAKIAFCILSSTVSTILFISLSILSLKHLSKVFTFIAFLLITGLTLEVQR